MNILITLFLSVSFALSNYNQFNQAFIDVSKNQSPSIVSIISEKTEKVSNMFFFNPFEDFGFDQNPHEQERKAQSLGSGVIINKNQGYIITNNHVIEGAEEIKVVLFDKREVSAKIVGTDPLSDIAVIQIDSDDYTTYVDESAVFDATGTGVVIASSAAIAAFLYIKHTGFTSSAKSTATTQLLKVGVGDPDAVGFSLSAGEAITLHGFGTSTDDINNWKLESASGDIYVEVLYF